jgi:hypothetical protein
MEYLVVIQLEPIQDLGAKIERLVELFTRELPELQGLSDYNRNVLHQIVVSESSKVYLVKEVKEINKNEVFKPYKDLCARVSELIKAYHPAYLFPHSLSTTLIETAHSQLFFSTHLPKLTDVKSGDPITFVEQYLKDLVFKALAH